MKKNILSRKLRILPFVLILFVLILFLFFYVKGFLSLEDNEYQPVNEAVFIQREDDTYTLAEICYPQNYDGAMPLIAIAHGFTGTKNSGGAEELSHRLAVAGYATIRMDFNPRLQPQRKSETTNIYTLSSMEDDMVRCINHMIAHYYIDVNRIGLYARSMGGRVVMKMANQSSGGYEFQALALVAPAGNETSMIDYMGGIEAWKKNKKTANADGFLPYQGLKLTPQWFEQFESYNPCDHGDAFGEKPVLVICNTLDYVVTETTSRECASAYKNSRVIQVTTKNYHGYEMSIPDSDLKNYLMGELVDFFIENL